MLYLSVQVAAVFGAHQDAAALEPAAPAVKEVAAPVQSARPFHLNPADPSWDEFVFAAASAAIALELFYATPVDEFAPAPTGDASWAFQAPEPGFDFLAALTAVEQSSHDGQWLG